MDLLTWAIIVAVVAGALGFTGVASGAATLAKWLFVIFVIIAVVLLILVFLGISILDNAAAANFMIQALRFAVHFPAVHLVGVANA